MIFNYEKKLASYQKSMNFLNECHYDTMKIKRLIAYARSNGIITSRNNILGELEAIYDFYLLDFHQQMNKANSCDEQNKQQYLDRADADMLIIDSLSEDNKIKELYTIIYNNLVNVEKLEKYIKEEDKISFKPLEIKKI